MKEIACRSLSSAALRTRVSDSGSEKNSLAACVWSERSKDHCGQVIKGTWRMSWRQKAMKGVEDCDKPGEAV